MTPIIKFKQNSSDDLHRGELLVFHQTGNELFNVAHQLWLVDENWQALAEVSVMSQQLDGDSITGQVRVDYIYNEQECEQVTDLLIRMYACRVDPYIYFLIGEAEYLQAKSRGQLVRDSLATEGFLHGAPKNQLARLANKYYREVDNLQVMRVAVDKLECQLKWEPATGGLYPHVYGPLQMDAVVDIVDYEHFE